MTTPFNDRTTPASLLATRRSGKARDMVEPGPSAAELDIMLATAARVPDHGKLAPWRFVTIAADRRAAFADVLEAAYRVDKPDPGRVELAAVRDFAAQAPALVVVLSVPVDSHIPRFEQELSAGGVCTMLCAAASAQGYVANWLTGWAAYSPAVVAALGGPAGAKIAGFIFIGSPLRALDERPRPTLADIVRAW